MKNQLQIIRESFFSFIARYTEMELLGKKVHCPYWRNKLKNGRVIIHGYLGGKGDPESIRKKLLQLLREEKKEVEILSDSEKFTKFAKRNRIGADCSGLAYRLIDELVKLGYPNNPIKRLEKIFPGGVFKTNADALTSGKNVIYIEDIAKCKMGDLIRVNSGRHVLTVVDKYSSQIHYVHAHEKTFTDGVHQGLIKLTNFGKSLQYQEWLEKLKTGENFGYKYFHKENGDGIFRPKIFA